MVNNKKSTMTSGANVKKIIPGAVKKIVSPVVKKAPAINTQKNNIKKDVAKVEPLQEVRIKKVGILSVATTFSLVGIVIGLISSIILIPFYSLLSPLLISLGLPGIFSNLWIAFLLIPLFGISCFILGAIFSLFYNLASLITKGIKLFS